MTRQEARKAFRAIIAAERELNRLGRVEAIVHTANAKLAILKEVEPPIRSLWRTTKLWRRRRLQR